MQELCAAPIKLAREQKESPDVETPGLLVKALISSFFISKVGGYLKKFKSCTTNIAGKKHTNKRKRYYFAGILPFFFSFNL